MKRYFLNLLKNKKFYSKAAFTLVEVLITIGIIGVVAGLVMPALIAKINNIVYTNTVKVTENRLIEGLNNYNTMEHGLSLNYADTQEFIAGLSKYYKIIEICPPDKIGNCFPYDQISYNEGNNIKQLNVSELANPEKLGLDASLYLEPAAFVNAQGIPFVIAIKKDCPTDSEQAMREISSCIAGLYDVNGVRKPNKFAVLSDVEDSSSSKDIVSINGGRIGPVANINGVALLTKFFKATQATVNCSAEVQKNYGVKKCPPVSDKWVDAMAKCHELGGDLPSIEQSLKIVQGLFYKGDKLNHPDKFKSDGKTLILQYYTYNSVLAESIGLPRTSSAAMWTNDDQDAELYYATERQYRSVDSSTNGCNRNNPNHFAVCVAKEN